MFLNRLEIYYNAKIHLFFYTTKFETVKAMRV